MGYQPRTTFAVAPQFHTGHEEDAPALQPPTCIKFALTIYHVRNNSIKFEWLRHFFIPRVSGLVSVELNSIKALNEINSCNVLSI